MLDFNTLRMRNVQHTYYTILFCTYHFCAGEPHRMNRILDAVLRS